MWKPKVPHLVFLSFRERLTCLVGGGPSFQSVMARGSDSFSLAARVCGLGEEQAVLMSVQSLGTLSLADQQRDQVIGGFTDPQGESLGTGRTHWQ